MQEADLTRDQMPPTTIARLMLAIAFVAIDAALLRSVNDYDPGALVLVPALQAAVFLAFPPGGGRRPFWAGFLATGSVLLLLYSGVRGPIHRPFDRWCGAVFNFLRERGYWEWEFEFRHKVLTWGLMMALTGLPLVAIAVMGGLGARIYAGRKARVQTDETSGR
jgi:hypothetical protein